MCFCICLLCLYMHTLPFLRRTRVSFVLSTLLFIFNNVYAQTCSKTAQGLTTTEMTVISKVSTLATTQWLRKQIGSSNTATRALRILDTSFVRDKQVDTYTMDYLEGHIPQALFFDLHKCVESTPSIPRNLPDPACFTSYVRKLGIWPDTHVVAYDRFGPASAYRTWWLFRLYGHTNISVLDGGYRKWVADGYDTTKEEPEVEPSMFIPQLDRFLVRTFDDMAENLRTCREQVVDARGATDRAVVDTESGGGKIPGSRHVSFEELFNEDGTMKTEKQLKSMFDDAGLNLQRPLVATCNTGMTACGVAAAAHILGRDIPVYYGSWTEWRQRAREEHTYSGCTEQQDVLKNGLGL